MARTQALLVRLSSAIDATPGIWQAGGLGREYAVSDNACFYVLVILGLGAGLLVAIRQMMADDGAPGARSFAWKIIGLFPAGLALVASLWACWLLNKVKVPPLLDALPATGLLLFYPMWWALDHLLSGVITRVKSSVTGTVGSPTTDRAED